MTHSTTSASTVSHHDAQRPQGIGEDWLAVWLGLAVVALALLSLAGVDLLGWAVTTRVWTGAGIAGALAPIGKGYAAIGGIGSLVLTWLILLAVLSLGAAALKADAKRFALRFTVVFWIAYAAWIIGSEAHLAVTTAADARKFGIGWWLQLTSEFGLVVALVAGLVIGNLFPRLAAWLGDAIRPELYIKTALVILGAFIAVTAAERLGFAAGIVLRGAAAIIEAYLIYWAVVYFVARKWFGFSREWAAPLASGISICGVAASIATGSAIRARTLVPVVVSSLVVVFAAVELLVLPFLAQHFLWQEPLVAASWLGLAIKTDGAAVASGGIAESLILARAAAEGVKYAPGWLLGTTVTIKLFIDIFIGLWAFLLAWVWTRHINPQAGDKARAVEIWQRFPKFIIGYLLTFVVVLLATLAAGPDTVARIKAVSAEANNLRVIFFLLTFFSIGVLSNFRKLWEEGLGKLVAVYVLALFGFVIWVGLLISWIFFAGVKPPLAG
ncbi:MAG: putative sulfate exporter family transporter [Xenophilus sp.]